MNGTSTTPDFGNRSFYVRLGVSNTATPEEIKHAYKSLALAYHPDKSKDPNATAIFQQIAEAYETLKDPKARARHDETLADAPADGCAQQSAPRTPNMDMKRAMKLFNEACNSMSEACCVVGGKLFENPLPPNQRNPAVLIGATVAAFLSGYAGAMTGDFEAGIEAGVSAAVLGASQYMTGNALQRAASVDLSVYAQMFHARRAMRHYARLLSNYDKQERSDYYGQRTEEDAGRPRENASERGHRAHEEYGRKAPRSPPREARSAPRRRSKSSRARVFFGE